MAFKAFLDTDKTLDKLALPTGNLRSYREQIKHTLTGSQHAVTWTIQVLHQLGYADVNDWSPLFPSENPGEVISVLIRTISVR